MHISSYILWLGNIIKEDDLKYYPAVSPAANGWQIDLISALQQLNINIYSLGHIPEPLWPKGRYYIKATCKCDNNIKGVGVNYWNIPFIRNKYLTSVYMREFKKICDRIGKPSIIMSYNIYNFSSTIGLYAQKEMDIPWVCIIADAPPSLNPDMLKYDEISYQASGRIYLSWSYYNSCIRQPKLHLDGGISNVYKTYNNTNKENQNNNIILYAGSLTKHGGIDLLIDSLKFIKNNTIQLWICGFGNNPNLKQAIKKDGRIKYLGFVKDSNLKDLFLKTKIFINPRPTNYKPNQYNFPSKVLEYLSYAKPIITTKCNAFSPEYNDLLIFLDEENPKCLANTIEDVLSWSEEKYNKCKYNIENYIISKKLWAIHAKRLINWIENRVLTRKPK